MTGRQEKEILIDKKIAGILQDMPELVTEWHSYLRRNGKFASTRLDYVQKICRFIREMNIMEADQITTKIIEQYWDRIMIKKTGEKASYPFLHSTWQALKSFLVFAQDQGYIKDIVRFGTDRKIMLGSILCPAKPKDDNTKKRIYLTWEDFEKMLAAVDEETSEVACLRDKAILLTLMSTGMREEALIEINLEDLDMETSHIRYIDKMGKHFDKKLGDRATSALDDWLKVRGFYLRNSKTRTSQALFLSKRGERISHTALQTVVVKYSKQALGYELMPHKIRGGFATILYETTKDPQFVREMMGHTSLTTTGIYFAPNGNNADRLAAIMDSNM